MTQFLVTEAASRRVLRGVGRPDPVGFAGVPDARPMPHDGLIYYPWQGRLVFSEGPTPTSEYRWPENATAPVWIETGSLDELRLAKIAAISGACRSHILAGFECEALGETYLYPAKLEDQANLVASVADSLLAGEDPDWTTPFWCVDAAGAWEYREHTITQIQQVGRTGKAAILAALRKNEQLAQQITVATAEQLQTITW